MRTGAAATNTGGSRCDSIQGVPAFTKRRVLLMVSWVAIIVAREQKVRRDGHSRRQIHMVLVDTAFLPSKRGCDGHGCLSLRGSLHSSASPVYTKGKCVCHGHFVRF